MLLWSRGQAFTLNPMFDESEANTIHVQIDAADQGTGFVDGTLPYDMMEDKTPLIAGSFTGWRYKKMMPLHEFTKSIDKEYQDPIEKGKYDGDIRKKVTTVKELNEFELACYNKILGEQKRRYIVGWADYFNKYLVYKQPCVINGAAYHSIVDCFDVWRTPSDYHMPRMQVESDTESEEEVVEVKVVKKGTVQEEVKAALPEAPDESACDIVYCLPFFAKPGRHNYLIKFKSSDEPN